MPFLLKLSLVLVLSLAFPEKVLTQGKGLMSPETRRVKSDTIGCLLPLRGKYAPIGEKALKGILTAAGAFQYRPGDEFKVVVKDVGEGVEKKRKALQDMVLEDKVAFVIGPILADSVKEIDYIVKALKVPTMVFPISESKEYYTVKNPYLIRFFYPPRKQARALAEYALQTLGVNTFSILYPRTEIGETFKDSFYRALIDLGGGVVSWIYYEPEVPDLSAEVRQIKLRNPRAIFIPDGASSSGEVISKLVQEGLTNVTFLGPNSWNSPAFLGNARENAEGVIFTDYFYPRSNEWMLFNERFRRIFGEEPGFLEFQTYEAASFIIKILRTPVQSRDEIIERILKIKNNPIFEVNQNQVGGIDITPRPLILTVKNGEIVRVR